MPNIPTDSCDATTITRAGRSLLSFGGCNYLGLAHHPRVVNAVREAAAVYGLSSSASRETTGNARPHSQLEDELADFCGHADALLVPDGYTANLAAMQGLEQLRVHNALLDERAHASLTDAARLAGMRIIRYRHLDAAHAAEQISQIDGACVIMTDSVFTTDGDLAPARGLLKALRPLDRLLLDDCHGFTVLGDQGRGTPDALGLRDERLIVTTTLAKGLGCAGGVVMGSHSVVDSARTHSIAYRCTTPASPALVAGGVEAMRMLREDHQIHIRLGENIERMRETLRALGIPAHEHPTAIFAFVIGDLDRMRRIEEHLLENGVLLPLMAYPNGPAPMYFRLAINASHTTEQIEQFSAAMASALTHTQELHEQKAVSR